MRITTIICLMLAININLEGQVSNCEWISKRPIDELHYIGIGNSSMENSNYIEVARNNALNDLSAEIISIVQSRTDYVIGEADQQISESFQRQTKVHTSGIIQGFEVVETCTKEDDYWIYIRLNKEKYNEETSRIIQETIDRANRVFTEGLDYEQSMNISSAFSSFVVALNILRTFRSSHIAFDYSEPIRTLENSIINQLNALIRKITFDGFENSYSISFINNIYVISGFVLFDNVTVGNIPIFVLSENVELYNYNLHSDAKTGLQIQVKNVFETDTESKLDIRIDYRRMLSSDQLERSVSNFVNNLTFNNRIITLAIEPKNIFIESNTKLLSQSYNGFDNNLKAIFHNRNFRIVNNPNQADYIITISSDTRKGNVIKELGVVIALLACDISIKDQNGNHIYSRSYNNIRGTKQDYSEASMDAYRKLIEEINKNMKEINAVLR